MFFACPFDAMGSTAATYGGQNIGAGKLDRISKGLRIQILIGLVYSTIACIIMWTFGTNLVKIFLDEPSELLLQNTALYLRCNSAAYFLLALVNIIRFLIQGMGYPILAICAGIFEMIARAFAGAVLVKRFGYIAACLASPLAWVLADIFLVIAYLRVMKNLKRRLRPDGIPAEIQSEALTGTEDRQDRT
jgi:Na+-driven multidrug efflux pump